MAIIHAGNEQDVFTSLIGAASVTPETVSALAITDVNRAGMSLRGSSAGCVGKIILDTPLRSGWFRVRMYVGVTNGSEGGSTGVDFLKFLDENDQPILWLNLAGDAGNNKNARIRSVIDPSGTTLTGNVDGAANVRDYDFNWFLDPVEGYLRVYAGEGLIYEVAGDTMAGLSDKIKTIQLCGMVSFAATNCPFISHLIVSTTPTFGGRVYTLPIIDTATYDGWTGDVSNINGTTYNPMSGINAVTNNQTVTFDIATMPDLPPGVELNAVILSNISRYADNAEVTEQIGVYIVDSVLLESGTRHVVGNPSSKGVQHVFEVTPDGGDWTVAAVNAAEFGIRAKVAV